MSTYREHPGPHDLQYQERQSKIVKAALDYTPGRPVPVVEYTDDEHLLWRMLQAELTEMHRNHACQEFLEGAEKLSLPADRLPQVGEVSSQLKGLTEFSLSPAPGMLGPRDFYGSLAERRFQATQYIRHCSTLYFSPEPDMIHEVVGHGTALAHDRWASLYVLFGKAIRRIHSPEAVSAISNVFWFTMETGLIQEHGKTKVCGASLLSSVGELAAFTKTDIRPLDLQSMKAQEYVVGKCQPLLFCAESFDHLEDFLTDFLTNADAEQIAAL